jgi:PAS domain S-box-containing protein
LSDTEKINILLVDDYPENLLVMDSLLESPELNLQKAGSGNEALGLLLENEFALVLLDVQMPEMDGFETAELMRGNRITRSIPIIFVTAFNQEPRHVFKGYDAGAVDFLFKPLDPHMLKSKVHVFVELYKQRKNLEETGRNLSRAVAELETRSAELAAANEQLKQEIKERELFEAALQQSEERYRTLIETIPHGIQEIDLNGRIIFVNTALEKIYKFDPGALTGQSVLELVKSGSDRQRFEKYITGLFDKHEVIETYVGKGETRDGRLIDFQLDSNYKRDALGAVIGLISVFTDITERKKMEVELLKTKKLEATGILAGGIAHDFNNLLSPILGYMDLAMLDLTPDSQLFKRMDEVKKAAERGRNLTRKFITFASGGAPIISGIITRAFLADTADRVLANSGVAYELSLADNLWPAEIDEHQVGLALQNILDNARENSDAGQIVGISTENIEIRDPHSRAGVLIKDGKYLRIRIQDQGRGISEQNLGRIFDPYFSTKEMGVQKGMGMGLTVAHSIIKQHHGNIAVESTLGIGTTVDIYLPAAPHRIGKEAIDD